MRVMRAKVLFQQLTASYFAGANVVFSNQSRAAKQKQPLVVLTVGNLNRPAIQSWTASPRRERSVVRTRIW